MLFENGCVCALLGYQESTRYSLLLRLDRFDRITKIISRKSAEFSILIPTILFLYFILDSSGFDTFENGNIERNMEL